MRVDAEKGPAVYVQLGKRTIARRRPKARPKGTPLPDLEDQMHMEHMFDAKHWGDVGRFLAQRLETQLAP